MVMWQYITRTALLTLLVVVPTLAITPRVGAEAENDAYTNSITEIQVCEAMGGKAEVTTYQTGAGDYQVYVECRGGAMDGFDCINDLVETKCEFSRFDPDRELPVLKWGDIAPHDEPAVAPDPGVVEVPMTPAPNEATVVTDAPTFPTPTPDSEAGLDPAGSDPAVSDGEVEAEPTSTPEDEVLVEPIVDEGAVIEEIGEAESVDKPSVPEVRVGVDDIAPIEEEPRT